MSLDADIRDWLIANTALVSTNTYAVEDAKDAGVNVVIASVEIEYDNEQNAYRYDSTVLVYVSPRDDDVSDPPSGAKLIAKRREWSVEVRKLVTSGTAITGVYDIQTVSGEVALPLAAGVDVREAVLGFTVQGFADPEA